MSASLPAAMISLPTRGFVCGFTLIEMVVALALTGLIAAAMFDALRFAQNSYRRVAIQGERASEVFAAQQLIRRLVESAYPEEDPAFGGGLRGTAARLELTAVADLASGAQGLNRYQLSEEVKAGKHNLTIRWAGQHVRLGNHQMLTEEVLLPDVASVSWSYLPAVEGELTAAQWSNEWSDRDRLPVAVRLRVTFPAGDPRVWTDVIAAPRLTDDANCAFDIVAQQCRRGS